MRHLSLVWSAWWKVYLPIYLFQVIDLDTIEDADMENVLDVQKYISPRILSQAVVALTAVPKVDPKDAEAIAKATLVTAHHPCIGRFLIEA